MVCISSIVIIVLVVLLIIVMNMFIIELNNSLVVNVNVVWGNGGIVMMVCISKNVSGNYVFSDLV